ncbi:hypothetical protein WICMUC_005302 [Wickerhamomyces mucosus]|uniref:Uncharacterized protein n=1 Tax=Wickerhamomyces mucosus TaxID=1378264 RepID=A0A9P8P9N2_9ASCO|nr:hypothetical protein WICMUC_005302 [Wickerhamomyces mucosus]
MAPQVKREDLVVPYVHVPPAPEAASSAVVSQSMPMAALFMKNKLLGWFSLLSTVQAYLNELHGAKPQEGSTSALLRLLLSVFGILVCYTDLVFPGSSGFVKKNDVAKVAESISSTISNAQATGN